MLKVLSCVAAGLVAGFVLNEIWRDYRNRNDEWRIERQRRINLAYAARFPSLN